MFLHFNHTKQNGKSRKSWKEMWEQIFVSFGTSIETNQNAFMWYLHVNTVYVEISRFPYETFDKLKII